MIEITKYDEGSILDLYIFGTMENEKYRIEKNHNQFWQMINKEEDYYKILSIDTVDMVRNFAKKLMDKNFDSILISGLGMGILPFFSQREASIVHVVEIDSKVINLTTSIGHLGEKVKIYNTDINHFEPKIKYDVILFDHWMSHAKLDEINVLKNKFGEYLNDEGIITIPIYEQSIR